MKKRILSAFIIFILSLSTFTFVASADEVYPKYSNVELELFNDMYAASGSSYSISITGDLEKFNGYYLIIYGRSDSYCLLFFKEVTLTSRDIIVTDYFILPSFSHSPHFNVSPESFLYHSGSFAIDVSPLYIYYSSISFEISNATIISTFPWPTFSPAQQFGNDFPSFISSAWSGLTNFIVDNKLVLFIFGLTLLFAIVGLVKRCIK